MAKKETRKDGELLNLEVQDMIRPCYFKTAFLCDILSQDHAEVFKLSFDGMCGLFYILDDLRKELDNINSALE